LIVPWPALEGQRHVRRVLEGALRRGSVSHAYLFSGPEGMDTTGAALGLAMALNCSSGNVEPCGRCRACRDIEARRHPDVRVVMPEGRSLKIDQVRDVVRSAHLKPARSGYRVYVFEGAELLTSEAANALLRLAEEPPGHAVIVLTCTNTSALPRTLVSRCTEIRFRPIPLRELADMLSADGVPRGLARLAGAMSRGVLEKAAGLATSGAAREARDLAIKLAERIPGGAFDPVATAERLEELLSDRGLELSDFLDVFELVARDILILSLGCPEELVVSVDLVDELRRLERGLGCAALVSAIAAAEEAKRAVARRANRRLATEALLIRLHRL